MLAHLAELLGQPVEVVLVQALLALLERLGELLHFLGHLLVLLQVLQLPLQGVGWAETAGHAVVGGADVAQAAGLP